MANINLVRQFALFCSSAIFDVYSGLESKLLEQNIGGRKYADLGATRKKAQPFPFLKGHWKN